MKTLIITVAALFLMSFQLMAQKSEVSTTKFPKGKKPHASSMDISPQKAVKKNVLTNNTSKMVNLKKGPIIRLEPKKAPSAM